MLRRMKPALVTGMLAGLLAACSGGGKTQTYALPVETVHGKLYGAPLLREVCEQDYGLRDSSIRMESRTAERISWIVSSRGRDWIRLTADMKADGEQSTAVTLKSKLILKDNGFGDADPAAHTLTVAKAGAMFHEKIDSTLMGRPFEFRRVAAEVDAHVGYPTPPQSQQRVDRIQDVAPYMDRYAIDSSRREKPPRNAPGERASC